MNTRTLTIESKTEQLIKVRRFVSGAARDFGFSDDDVSKIALAVDEACTNVIKHAYKFDDSKSIVITVRPENGGFEVVISDTGRRFNPDDIKTPDMKDYLENFRKGGLGVLLMKKLMDEVEYKLQPGAKNEVRLVKYLSR